MARIMTEEERKQFKARKARLIEGVLRNLFGDRKAEARLAEIARLAERCERERELQKLNPQSEDIPQ
jgi:hypothetical protein